MDRRLLLLNPNGSADLHTPIHTPSLKKERTNAWKVMLNTCTVSMKSAHFEWLSWSRTVHLHFVQTIMHDAVGKETETH